MRRGLKVHEDEEDDNRGSGRRWWWWRLYSDGGACGVVTSPRGVLQSAGEEKARQRCGDATKALITADAAFTRSRRIKWIY